MLIRSQIKLTLQRKESLLVFLFALFPLLLIVVSLIDTNFMQLSAPNLSMSFLTFFEAVISVQYQTFLPIVAIIYLIVVSVGDEIEQGKLIIYKDISRSYIILSKICSIVTVYLIYFFCTVVSSLVTYFTHLIHMSYTSGKLWANINEIQYSLLTIVSIISIILICILLTVLLSIKLNNSLTILMSSLFILFSYIAPNLTFMKYLFPNSYIQFLNGSNFLELLILIIFNALFVSGLLILLIIIHFKKVEF